MSEVARTNIAETAPADSAEELPFLTRWSRRKLGQESAPADEPPAAIEPVVAREQGQGAAVEIEESVDPRTGKRMSDLTDEDMPDPESLDQDSDLTMFMAEKVSRSLRMRALTKVFHTAKFNQVCLCAEYAEDYTNFTPLGDIVPHDLQQAILREAGKLCEQLAEKGLRITPEEAQARVAAEYRGERLPVVDALCAPAGGSDKDVPAETLARTADEQPERLVPPPDTETT